MDETKTANTPANQEIVEIDLLDLAYDFVRIAKRIWWLFLVLILCSIGAWFIFSYANYTPMYRCEATFTVSTGDESSFYYSSSTAGQLSKTFPYILNSSYFRSVLLDALGTKSMNGTITAETISNSNIVTMVVESPSSENAVSILQAALEVYPTVSRFVLGKIEFRLIDDIQVPTAPYNQPSLIRVLGYGGLTGLACAIVIVGFMALFRNTIKNREDMEQFSSLPCFGALPLVKRKARKMSKESHYLSVLDSRTPHGFRESMHALEARVKNTLDAQNAKVLLVTSSVASEGKTTVSINLAEQLARSGARVLLVDLDLRSQKIGQLLGYNDGAGVVDVLQDPSMMKSRFVRWYEPGKFFLWAGKRTVNNPAEMLSNPYLPKILDIFKKQVDYIILDTPPCGLFQDAAILADNTDAALLVVGYDTVSRNDVLQSLSILESRRAKCIGYLFNSYPQTSGHYGYGRYGYGRYGYSSYGSKYGKSSQTSEENHSLHLGL